jgi:hypothetical protein
VALLQLKSLFVVQYPNPKFVTSVAVHLSSQRILQVTSNGNLRIAIEPEMHCPDKESIELSNLSCKRTGYLRSNSCLHNIFLLLFFSPFSPYIYTSELGHKNNVYLAGLLLECTMKVLKVLELIIRVQDASATQGLPKACCAVKARFSKS